VCVAPFPILEKQSCTSGEYNYGVFFTVLIFGFLRHFGCFFTRLFDFLSVLASYGQPFPREAVLYKCSPRYQMYYNHIQMMTQKEVKDVKR